VYLNSKMNRIRCAISVFIFLILNTRLFAEGTNQWKAEVYSLQILAPAMENNTNMTEKYRHAMAKLHAQDGVLIPGVTVGMVLTAPEGQIVGFNQPDAISPKLVSFTDDTGKDLLAQMPWETYYPKGEYGIYTYGFNNGEPSLLVGIRAPGLPSKSATALNIIGKIWVQTAIRSEQLIAQNVKLKPGTEFDLGDIKLEVSDAKYNDGHFVIDLESAQDLSSISKLQFFDKRGKEISPLNSDSDNSAEGSEWVCFFHKHLDTVKIVATHWMGFKTTDVSFKVKTGLGL
jgi:hypothetical protein